VLLVLDNFEQLVGRAEGARCWLLTQLPLLHLLVTSRRSLGWTASMFAGGGAPGPAAADAGVAAAAASHAAVALL
jgi:hypothetical protein